MKKKKTKIRKKKYKIKKKINKKILKISFKLPKEIRINKQIKQIFASFLR